MRFTSIDKMLNPTSIAIIGANEKDGYGGRFMRNLLKNKFQGQLYPVNPKYTELFGLSCYPSISAIGQDIDLAVIIIKSDLVINTVEECAQNNVRSVLIITAGFSEADKLQGTLREQKLKEIAEETGMRIVGPNCLGLANVKENLWACSLSTLGVKPIPVGRAGLVSHSGATGFGPLLNQARDRGVGFKYIVTTGNEADLGLCDFIDYMLDDPEIVVVATLIEGIKDGQAFIQVARKAKKLGKKLVVLKIGESEVGSRAAASHTASMTGDKEVFNALVKQYGLLKVDDYDEMIELVKMIQYGRVATGKNMAVFSHSGGIAGFVGDQLGKYGLDVPELPVDVQEEIDQYLQGFGSPKNPLDLTGHMKKNSLIHIAQIVNQCETIDAFVFATHGNTAAMEKIIEVEQLINKPLYVVWTGSLYDEGLDILRQSHIPVSFLSEKFAKLLSLYIHQHSSQLEETSSSISVPALPVSQYPTGYLNEVESKQLMSLINIPIPDQHVLSSWEDVEQFTSKLTGQAYVMKIISKKVIHKSDEGGVALNLQSVEDIQQAYARMLDLKNRKGDDIEGILVEEMCPAGLDLVIGIKQDEQFGPVMMLGFGGIYTELFKQITWRVLPIERSPIVDMVQEIPGLTHILGGYRNQPVYDLSSLVDAVEHIAHFVDQNQQHIELLEINPIRVLPEGKGVMVLDCVIKMK